MTAALDPAHRFLRSLQQVDWRATTAACLLVAALLFATGWAVLAFVSDALADLVAWPPAGIALVAVLVLGNRVLPGVALGVFLLEYRPEATLLSQAGCTAAAVLEAWLGAAILRRMRVPIDIPRIRDVMVLGLGAGIAATIPGGLLATGAMVVDGIVATDRFWQVAALWTFGDAVGVLYVVPLAFAWRRFSPSMLDARALGLLAVHVGLCWLIFSGILVHWFHHPTVAYLAFPLLTAIALTARAPVVTAALAVLVIIGTVGTYGGSGPFGAADLVARTFLLHTYFVVAATTTLLLHALADDHRRATRRLAESERYLDGLVDALPTPISVKDAQSRFLTVNEAFCAFAGRTREELLGSEDLLFLSPKDSSYTRLQDERALRSNRPLEYEYEFDVGGTARWMLVRKSTLARSDGSQVVISCLSDVTTQKMVERQLRASEHRFRDFAEVASEYVWETDAEGRFTFVSSRVTSVTGYREVDLLGKTFEVIMPPGEYERVTGWIEEHRQPDGSFRDLEHRVLTKAGEILWVLVNGIPLRDGDGNLIGQRGSNRDITDRKKAEERISILATRDPLTGLPNRLLFNDRLEQGLVNARRKRESLALMFIDLDRFKNINDSLGHDVGDLLLKEVAQRMGACLRKGDTLSRLGGDEFVVTLEGLVHAEDAAQVAQKIIASLARPMQIDGHMLTTSCSIGISIFPADADDSSTLMKNADTAMYHAKEKGRRNFQFFSREMNIRAVEQHNVETALRLALERDEFELYYQPQLDIATGRVAGMEALLRWRHPEKGILPPSMFIDVAEETGLIEPIGQWVLRAACAQAKEWQDNGFPKLRVAVNVSARQFNPPREFTRTLSRVLASTGLPPDQLELEMTESVLLHNAEENIQILRRLGKLGTRIAVDDFGTGYSSLSYLRQLPIHTLKIDRSFVRDLEDEKDSEVIVSTIIAMAHSLKLRVTAEGVENLAQLSILKRLGCDEYQGFLFSKPVRAEEFQLRFLAPRELNFGS